MLGTQRVNRVPLIGTSAAVTTLGIAAVRRQPALIPLRVAGEGLAWVGHFFVEATKPASFIPARSPPT
jgi:hypothetical protein